jgi:hypothetical protein
MISHYKKASYLYPEILTNDHLFGKLALYIGWPIRLDWYDNCCLCLVMSHHGHCLVMSHQGHCLVMSHQGHCLVMSHQGHCPVMSHQGHCPVMSHQGHCPVMSHQGHCLVMSHQGHCLVMNHQGLCLSRVLITFQGPFEGSIYNFSRAIWE